MRNTVFAVSLAGLVGLGLMPGHASSHREAPLISHDPTADNTDVYAFTTPNNTVTLIANWIPFENPAGGPNFYRFDSTVAYDLYVDNNGDAREDVVFRWQFTDHLRNPNTFLYATGPVTSLDDPDLNVFQTYTLTVMQNGQVTAVGGPFPVAPVNIGASTPNYGGNFTGIQELQFPQGLGRVVAGQFDDPFYLDLRVFDLLYGGDLSEAGNDTLAGYNVHATAIEVPTSLVTSASNPIIGVWSAASRRTTTVRSPGGETSTGPYVQVSRLGMPLVNEVVIPLGYKDTWNGSHPSDDGQFLQFVLDPELARLLNALYAIPQPSTPRDDLVSVFLTGVDGLNQPPSVTPSEMMRLNTAIAPTGAPQRLGVLAGDLAGFPNGRRLQDDVVDIALRVVIGALRGVDTPIGDGVDANDRAFGTAFPYLALPHSGGKAANLASNK